MGMNLRMPLGWEGRHCIIGRLLPGSVFSFVCFVTRIERFHTWTGGRSRFVHPPFTCIGPIIEQAVVEPTSTTNLRASLLTTLIDAP